MGEVHDWKRYKEEQYDRLAQLVRSSLDMDKIYEILGILKTSELDRTGEHR